tara:strand:+ start:20 stop:457 length:438 start_codon:yes stop_codon:yes gene_type:complete
MNITLENIKTAISNATIDGNFNSDLIENASLRKLAVNHYAKQIVKSGANTVLKDYVDTSTNVIGYSEPDSTNDISTINLGGNTALVIEKSDTHILGKFNHPTFSDKPYFTIFYMVDPENGEYNFSMGSYDLSLIDATNDFIRRNQ